jgi:hypothetical protein
MDQEAAVIKRAKKKIQPSIKTLGGGTGGFRFRGGRDGLHPALQHVS